jgi:predicted TIM-barrel fold metal-dependent hydrolase
MHENTVTTLDRRNFLKVAGAAAGAATLAEGRSALPAPIAPSTLIDVNVNLARWPLRRVVGDEAAALVARLQSQGVAQAWAGSFDGVLHKDIASVNARLVEECRRHGDGLLVPFGSINPKLPDWEEELRRCAETYHMRGIRLHPNYHGYKLDDPDFARLLRMAAERGLLVQLAVLMEDRRMMHPLLQVEPPDLKPLTSLVKQVPGLRLVLLNSSTVLRDKSLLDLIDAGEIYVDIAMLDGIGGLGNLLRTVPMQRVLFGSYAPLFYFQSALLKLKESPLSDDQLRVICHENARRLFA